MGRDPYTGYHKLLLFHIQPSLFLASSVRRVGQREREREKGNKSAKREGEREREGRKVQREREGGREKERPRSQIRGSKGA